MGSTDETIGLPRSRFSPGSCFAGRYRIIAELGTGGMGSVYRVHDLELDEDVAVKVIRPEIATKPEVIQRFGRELKLARRVSHRHVVRMYELMEDRGVRFIVMEYVEGENLKSLLHRAGRLELHHALTLAGQVCEGLAAAHRLGVIHRDLKPANIMIDRQGNARIMDFGLARSLAGDDITVQGMVLGTPRYMAPEQAAGAGSDHRTDIYAVGVILFEMLTGEAPHSPAWHALMARERGEVNATPVARASEIPHPLDRALSTCLEADPARRFQSVEELLKRLRAIAGPRTSLDDATPSVSTEPSNRPPSGASAGSIAVLPFTDLSPARDQDYFCEGIAEELIHSLAKIRDLRVAARTSAFSFKGHSSDIREIGRKLNVDTILEGSVRKAGDKLRITTQLVNVADGYHLWSERFDRQLRDIFAIQDEVTRAIVEHLKLTLLPREQQAVFARGTNDLEAHALYLKGLHYLWDYYGRGFGEAIRCFEEAIEKDPGFARAHVGISESYLQAAFWGNNPPTEACAKVKTHARKALAIDPTLGDAHGVLSYVHVIHDWHWEAARREAEEAVRLSPNSPMAHFYYSCFLLNRERFEQAVDEALLAQSPDPVSSAAAFVVGLAFGWRGDFGRSIEAYQAGLRIHPDFYVLQSFLGLSWYAHGQYEEAVSAHEKAVAITDRLPFFVALLAMANEQTGRNVEAEGLWRELEERAQREYVPPASFFLKHALRGNLRQALRWLERAGEAHDCNLGWIRVIPKEHLRGPGEPRIKAWFKKAVVKMMAGWSMARHRIADQTP